MLSYTETEKYLYERLPMFQRIGPAAYKKDLRNTQVLCEALGHPERKFKSIHVGGTNGKGSSAHMLASILQSAGFKTGLYTSPHLKSFTERMKVGGENCPEDFVVQFVNRLAREIEEIEPSFFEVTTVMAFEFFASQKVDIAVIEVGLGGRLDCTNVIRPELSLITNISFDHQALLGDTLPKIAGEKAGIIKKNTPVVISQSQAEVMAVFQSKAREMNAPIVFADNDWKADLHDTTLSISGPEGMTMEVSDFPLPGLYQEKNIPGVMTAISILRSMQWDIPDHAIQNGFRDVISNTGLKGRWQQIGLKPTVICDTGHNPDGIRQVMLQILGMKFKNLTIVFGVVNDKDPAPVLQLLPTSANYYFCEAPIPRAMKAVELEQLAAPLGLKGVVIPDVNEAVALARSRADEGDLIFVGGSTFVVAGLTCL
jgi:dihydrofolate synthase/folylpolyglutamate synthase